MPTSNEKKALWFLAVVALSGSAVRLWRATVPPTPDTAAELDRQLARVDSVREVRHQPVSRHRVDPASAAPASAIDLDRASATDIEALPGIGPALAKRIVADRDSAGTFGRVEALCAVRGIGPTLAEKLRPLVTFSGAPRPLGDAFCATSPGSRATRRAHVPQVR